MTVPIYVQFSKVMLCIPYDFLKFNFHILLSFLLSYGFKTVATLRIRKCLTFVIGQISSKIFGKIILEPL